VPRSSGGRAPVACDVVETAVQTCYRHPDRRAGVICQRCDRPICPDCMHQASVGFHCPECAKAGSQKVLRGPQVRQLARRGATVVTNALIGLNLAVYVAGIGSGLRTKEQFIGYGGLVGEGRRVGDVFLTAEAPVGELIGVAHGEWWRIVTSGFLHANLIHVGMNCFILYQLGQLLEPALGRLRFGLVYLVAMLTGSFGVLLLDPTAFTVGASGAVFGLMGMAVALMRSRGVNVFDTGLGGLLVLNLIITFTIPGISIGGHVGGLIGGFVAGWILTDLGPKVLRNPGAALALTAAFGVAMAAGSVLVA